MVALGVGMWGRGGGMTGGEGARSDTLTQSNETGSAIRAYLGSQIPLPVRGAPLRGVLVQRRDMMGKRVTAFHLYFHVLWFYRIRSFPCS